MISRKLQLEIESRVQSGHFATPDELITAALVLLDEQLHLEAELGAGLDSPERIRADADFYEQKRRELNNSQDIGQAKLNGSPIVAFAATTKPAEAKRFYGDLLGLTLTDESPAALVFDAHGTMLRIQIVPEVNPPRYTVLGWRVQDIAATVDALVQRGVAFERYPGMDQDARGIWTSPAGAKVAWFKDPDGNTLSLTQG